MSDERKRRRRPIEVEITPEMIAAALPAVDRYFCAVRCDDPTAVRLMLTEAFLAMLACWEGSTLN